MTTSVPIMWRKLDFWIYTLTPTLKWLLAFLRLPLIIVSMKFRKTPGDPIQLLVVLLKPNAKNFNRSCKKITASRRRREELEARGGRQGQHHHHRHEGAHEGAREGEAGGVRPHKVSNNLPLK